MEVTQQFLLKMLTHFVLAYLCHLTWAVGMLIKNTGHDSFCTPATVKGSQNKWTQTDLRLGPVSDSGFKAEIRPRVFTSS